MWTRLIVILLCRINFSITLGERTAVLILARGGSKGIPLKNLQVVGGISLLGRAILTAKRAGLSDITVSTDHPLIALEAIRYDVNIFKRASVTSSDWAPSIWGTLEFLETRYDVDTLVILQVTSPFTQAKHLQLSLTKLNYPKPFDCLFAVTKSYKLRWDYEKYYPINFNITKRPRRQDWHGEFVETGAFYITRTHLIKKGFLQNSNNNMTNFIEEVTFEDLEATDVISVELVPERKGLILKHCEYYVSSRRHGTTVTRRYNDFSQLYDVLYAKYPYRAVCSLPPKRVVVGGGSPLFLQRRRAALQRWLTIVTRHPVLAHDADLRTFLCETSPRLDKPKHDEFVLAGTQEDDQGEMSTDEMQASFVTEQEQLRLAHLGLGRLFKIFEKVENRCEAERADIRELGAALNALSSPAVADNPRWTTLKDALKSAADLAADMGDSSADWSEEEGMERMLLALDAVGAHRALCARLQRGLHAERAAAAHAPRSVHSAAAHSLRHRHRYALRAALQEGCVARAYALAALEALPTLLRTQGTAHARHAALWADLHTALRHPHCKPPGK